MSFGKRWAERYKLAWEADDPDAAAALYAPDCVFRSAPFREPEPPIDYTRRVFPEARAEDVHFGEPVEEGDRAAVEWWASYVEDGRELTLAGATVLRFDDQGLVVDHVDYWVEADGRRAPFGGWGGR